MHKNRYKYSLSEYQEVLESRKKSFGLILRNKFDRHTYFYKPKLKSLWHLDLAKNYKKKLLAKIYPVIQKGKFLFVTLTYDNKIYSTQKAYQLHKKHINKYFKHLRYIYPHFKYFYVVELTQNNQIHFHCVIEDKFSMADLQKHWFKITGNIIVKIKPVYSKNVGWYVTKYTTKALAEQPENFQMLFKNVSRVIVFSRNWSSGITGEEKTKDWELIAIAHVQDRQLQELFADDSFFVELSEYLEIYRKSNSPPPKILKTQTNNIMLL